MSNLITAIIENIKKIINLKYLLILPILYGMIFVTLYGVNVIFWDEWDFVRLWEHVEKNGWINFSLIEKLFNQHNEHRTFFPGIIMLISHRLSSFNTKIDMLIIQLMIITVYLSCIRYFYKLREINTQLPGNCVANLLLLFIGIACFSPIQWQNLIWGFQVAFYMAIFGAVISLYYFHFFILIGSKKHCILSILFGIIASFSSLHGLIVWPVMVILSLLCFVSGEHLCIKKIIPPIITGIVCFIIYFNGWKSLAGHGHPEFTNNFIDLLKFFFGSIGGMYFGAYSILTILFGGITVLFSIALVLLLFIQKKIKFVIFPIGLLGFSYGAILAIAIGRAGMGVETSSISSRYMSFSILSLIGIAMLVFQLFWQSDRKNNKTKLIGTYIRKLTSCIMILFCILLLFGNYKGILEARDHREHQMGNVSILQDYENKPLENLSQLFPFSSYEAAYARIDSIKKYRLNVFSNPIYNYNEISVSRLDGLNKIELTRWLGLGPDSFVWDDKYISIPSGWVIDYISEKEYTQVLMNVNGKLYKTAHHLSSLDVADYFGNPYYNNARFSYSYPVSGLNVGANDFSALVILNDGVTYYESKAVIIFLDSNGNISLNDYNEIPVSRLDGLNKIELTQGLGLGPGSFVWDDDYISIPSGWVIDYISEKEYTQVLMNVNGKLYKTVHHLSSPDVADYFGNPYYSNARFSYSYPVSGLNVGANDFSALVILNDGVTYYESKAVIILLDSNGNISLEESLYEDDKNYLKTIYKIVITSDISQIYVHDIHPINFINGNLVMECGTYDPHVVFQIFEPLTNYSEESFIRINFSNSKSGNLQLFYDYGDGFSEENSFTTNIEIFPEMTEIYYPVVNWMDGKLLDSVRIDPPDGTIFQIESIEILEK